MAEFLVKGGNYMATLMQAGGARHTDGLPSWVPEWDHPVYRPPLSDTDDYDPELQSMHYRAAAETKPMIKLGSNGTLEIEGAIVDEIACMSPMRYEFTDADTDSNPNLTEECMSAVLEFERDARSMIATIDVYPSGENVEEAYWRALSGNKTVAHEELPADFENTYTAFKEFIVVIDDEEAAGEVVRRAQPFYMALTAMSLGRRFCMFKSGCFGSVPRESVTGDVIAIFLGAQTPSVLRKDGDGYIFIGECYIHGMMAGEALTTEDFHVVIINLK